MVFFFDFVKIYTQGIVYLWPIIAVLLGVIVALGFRVGHLEGWTAVDSLYFAFITATSVGFGDLVPTKSRTKLLSIVIVLVGILLTGLIVAIGLEAAGHAFREVRGANAPIVP
jgi:voltage-gated potassium channel